MKTGVSYFGVRRPKWVFEDMKEIRSRGFTHVLHTWSEEDELYYRDTMEEIIAGTVELGLKVYVNPWGVGRVFGGEAYSELVARNPSMAQVASDGTPLVAACPNHPAFLTYMHEWIQSVCKTQVETIFWDEPHFHFEKADLNRWACHCKSCCEGFQERFGYPMPTILTPDVKIFREDSLMDFLSIMTTEVHRLGKRNSVCLLPPWFPAGLDRWERVAEMPFVDEIGSDPYWEKITPPETVQKNYAEVSLRIQKLCNAYGKEAQMWIKNYHIVKGHENDVAESTRLAYEAGVRNIFAWSFRGSEYLSWLRSDDPPKVWETQCKAFARCK